MNRVWIIVICLILFISGFSVYYLYVNEEADSEIIDSTAFVDNSVFDVPFLQFAGTPELVFADVLESESLPPADKITHGFSILVDELDICFWMCDDNIYSGKTIRPENRFKITSETPFASIYFIWRDIPGHYKIEWDGGFLNCGQNGFLHDYVVLPVDVCEVSITFEQLPVSVCDISIFSRGSLPDGVQAWNPPADSADILVFPTHSDDDVLFFGAMISYYAIERGLTVQTAFMVDHGLIWYRDHERLDGLWELGIKNYPVLGSAPDSPLVKLSDAEFFYKDCDILGWQVEQLRRFKPLVVVGHDLNGEYGNGGHKVNAHNLIQAVVLASDEASYLDSAVRYGIWDTPKLYFHLYEENMIRLDVDTPLEQDQDQRSPFQIAEYAYSFHKSQHHLSYKVRKGPEWGVYDCTAFGLYRSLVGVDEDADMMDHIDVNAWRNQM